MMNGSSASLQWSPVTVLAWGSDLGGYVPCVSTVTPCGRNCEKERPSPLRKQVFWFSVDGLSSPGSLEVLRGRRIFKEKGNDDCNLY